MSALLHLPATGSCSTGWAGIEAPAPAFSRAFPAATRIERARLDATLVRPARTGLVRARWPVTDTFRFPRSAVSGYFLAKLELTRGRARGKVTYIPLILRALPSRRSTILVQAAVNTWQAFNSWGGKSLFPDNSTKKIPASHVSFDRPYNTLRPAPLQWDTPLVRFLEREGYDVSYTTDVDTDRNPSELRRHRLVISTGQDEFWSKRMRDAFEAARGSGTNLAFLGAGIGEWQIRYQSARRTIVKYPDATADPVADPARKTVRFADLVPPRPECELLGLGYGGGLRGPNDSPRVVRREPICPWGRVVPRDRLHGNERVARFGWLRVGLRSAGLRGSSVDRLVPLRGRGGCGATRQVLTLFDTRLPRGLGSSARARSISSGDLTTTTGTVTSRPTGVSGSSCGTRSPI